MLKKYCLILLAFVITGSNLFFHSPISPAQKAEEVFTKKLTVLIGKLGDLDTAIGQNKSVLDMQQAFQQARLAYKQIEFLLEYYYPHLIRNINGPPLPFIEGEYSLTVLEPQGFQVMEEMIFPAYDPANAERLSKQVHSLRTTLSSILHQQDPYNFQDRFILDAVRLEIYRLIALGITGYDSQAAAYSLPETRAVITALQEIINMYAPLANNKLLKQQLNKNFTAAAAYLFQHNDFNAFDRLYFITTYADPLSEKLSALTKELSLTLPRERRLLSPLSPHLFAMAFYDPNVYSLNEAGNVTPQKVLLGEKLFYDTILSVNKTRSCASCHQPAKAFTDGLPKSLALDNINHIARNAPTLWNAAFQPKLFYDSRAVFAEEQVVDVVHNAKEMGSSMQLLVQRVKEDSAYTKMFHEIYTYTIDPLDEENVTNAIASYLRSLVALNTAFDNYMNGNRKVLSAGEKRGFNLFMGKAKCATCHFVPFFNGVAPPYFSEAESEVLNVPATTDTLHPVLDGDEGKYNFRPAEIYRHAFKTPGLRNIALTAPYMHNGVYTTLEEVIDFYDKGGGAGLGIAPENQTLPKTPLQLSATEKKELIAFLHTLTDTVIAKKR